MKKMQQDVVLQKVDRQSPLDPEDLEYIDQLLEKDLISVNPEVSCSYSLTSYGEIILVMGFSAVEKKKELEKKIPFPFRKMMFILTGILLCLILSLLLLM